MSINTRTLSLLLAVGLIIALASIAQATNLIMIGTNDGQVFGRAEYDLAPHIAASYANFGSTTPVTALAAINGTVAIGLNSTSYNVITRNAYDLGPNVGMIATGSGVSVMSTQSLGGATNLIFGERGVGAAWSGVFDRNIDDLTQTGTGYVGSVTSSGDGYNWGSPITALSSLPTGEFVVGQENGIVTVRKATDMFAYVDDVVPGQGYVNFGTPISAVAGLTDDTFAVALTSGYMDIRPRNDCWARIGSGLDWGVGVTSLVALSDGRIAIGLANGQVHVRSTSDLTAASLTSATFTGGAAITALALTADGNLAIGTADNLVFVRKNSDLTARPDGYVGSDGLNFGAPVTALAAVSAPVPEPSSLMALGAAITGLAAFRRRRR